MYLAGQHYENFPVASRLMPKFARPHVAAVYAFARIADDFADEGTREPAARVALLDDWRRRLHAAAQGGATPDASDASMVFVALADTMRRFDLGVDLFDDLISAFRQDVEVGRYEDWPDVLDYCRRSANPVGRLVLRIFGYREDRLDRFSDAICTALQLTNFWQDFEQDWRRGRLYVPLKLVRETGADERDLHRRRASPEWRAALGQAAATTRELFRAGRPLAGEVRGRLRWELRATWLGGMRILDRLESTRFDVFKSRPVLGWTDALIIGTRMLVWGQGPPPFKR